MRLHLSIAPMIALFALGAAAAQAQSAAPEPTLAELRASAEAGNAEAQNDLGGRLMATEDEASLPEARRWFERAAAAGHLEAKNNLATMLLLGLGGPADEARGRLLRDEAARQGSGAAHLSIAERYLRGAEGYPLDPARALEHIRSAAELPGPIASYAQWRVAMMHLQGVGTPRDPAEAFRWVVRASDGGSGRAMISRAVMLATGEGVTEDDAAARIWYQRAAESGDPLFAHALRSLGAMLVIGEGGPPDLARGIAYLRIAAAADDAAAPELLDRWATRVTPDIDVQAQRIADQWIQRHLSND
jgi:hypothetical protein